MNNKNNMDKLLTWHNNQSYINGSLVFYFWSTFGFPKEIFTEMVNDYFRTHPKARAKAIIKAYNTCHNTNYQF